MNPFETLVLALLALAAGTFTVVAIAAWLQRHENSGP